MEKAPAHAAAVRGALAPYPWRRLTPQMIVRRVLAAVDGADPGSAVAPDDPRVEPLLAVVSGVPWRALRLDALCRLLLAALDDWRVADALVDLELSWLLDEGG